MAQKLKWKVIREHEGDRFYREGDLREGTRADLGHLEGKVLVLIEDDGHAEAATDKAAADKAAADKAAADKAAADKAAADKAAADKAAADKAEQQPANKAEGAAPANKAASSRT